MTASAAREWSLTLYVSGASPRSAEAIDTVRRICDVDLAGRVDLQIIDVGDNPARRCAWHPGCPDAGEKAASTGSSPGR